MEVIDNVVFDMFGKSPRSYERVSVYSVIFDNTNEIAEKFHLAYGTVETYLYKAKREIENFVEKVKALYNKYINKTEQKYYAYVMDTSDFYLKVGYSKCPERRVKELTTNSKIGDKYELLNTWEFDNPEDAYEMEIWLHRYYKIKGGQLVGNDHFLNVEYDFDKDEEILNKKAEEIRTNSAKWCLDIA